MSLFPYLLVINAIFAVVIVFFERKSPTATLAWLMVLFLLPGIGFILYLFLGQNFTRKKMFSLKEQEDKRLMKLFEEQKAALISTDLQYPDPAKRPYRNMVRMLLTGNRAFITLDNEAAIYTRGEDKFEALLSAIADAQHHIHMEYFILNNDDLGRKVVDALARKAREGVEVRLLVDAMGTRWGVGLKKVFAELTDAGGRIAEFFPSLYRVNYRNHRKIAVIDGRVGFIGGFNIGDEYLGKGPLGNWRDEALKLTGSGVSTLQLRFMLDWNYASGEGLGFDPAYYPRPEQTGDVRIQIVSGGPDTRWNPVKEGYIKLINNALESVYIQTPYFVPGDSVFDAMRMAALSGVDVRLMLPCKPDHPFIYWASLSFAGDLLEAGVRVYTYDDGFIHAKTIVVDGVAGSVGSANWDARSFELNFESNAFFYDEALGAEMKAIFEHDLAVCTEITRERYAQRPAWMKIKEGVSRLFSPLG